MIPKSFNKKNQTACLSSHKSTQISAQNWMSKNKLKLNPDKTEFLLIGNGMQRQKFVSSFPIELLGSDISPAASCRNLGVSFDADFNFKIHVNKIVKSCFYYMRDLRRIRKHLTVDSATSLANALVSSRLDYCNSLLKCVSKKSIGKLQRVQNSLARIVLRSTRFTSASPLLKKLHWLPVHSRICFKINLLVYKILKY